MLYVATISTPCSMQTTPKFTSLSTILHSVDPVGVLRGCISDVFTWDTKNMLKCNPGKTEILHFTSPFNKQPTVYETLTLANTSMQVKIKAKNLSVIMDKTLSFTEHIVFESTFLSMGWKCYWTPLWFPDSTIAEVCYMTSQNTRDIIDKEFRILQVEW